MLNKTISAHSPKNVNIVIETIMPNSLHYWACYFTPTEAEEKINSCPRLLRFQL